MVDATGTTSIGVRAVDRDRDVLLPVCVPAPAGVRGLYVSQTDGERASLGGALSRGLLAGLGVLVTFTALLGATFWVGQSTLSSIKWFEAIAGFVLIGFGVLIVLERAPSLSIPLPKRRSSTLGFGVFGVGYALASAGCVAPLFISVVTRALSLSTTDAMVLLGTYVGTVVVLMIALTVATGMGLVAGAGRFAAYSGLLKRIAGVVMIAAGIGQLYLAIVVFELHHAILELL